VRFVHFADLHLDTPFAWADPRVAAKRRQALRDALVSILQLATDKQVDAVLCAGDLYEQDRFSPDTAAFYARQLSALTRCQSRNSMDPKFLRQPGLTGPNRSSTCYCSTADGQILKDINAVAVPADALVEDHCWKTICRARARNMRRVDEVSWSEVCTERGYLLRRQNSRGC
jgi:DNA repair exonuclease SbcCD nuclease subunit